ncbi:hypothetical protein ADO04_01322 [Streptococcus parauberis]|nr:hypothetical protein AKL13_00615 [Streptococcus parauberis]KYP21377.1 hypothetical protein TN39_00538 [Streptococcus parauberis]KYP22227.1 hypothetical protein AKL14_00224 [Streptococcus parauberis]KYP22971.1 hypothetical protein TM50_01992 [Streptococcus parauberis]KYP25036.1 hypothetical protein ADO04_01322 [Streptococcus parauberis]
MTNQINKIKIVQRLKELVIDWMTISFYLCVLFGMIMLFYHLNLVVLHTLLKLSLNLLPCFFLSYRLSLFLLFLI